MVAAKLAHVLVSALLDQALKQPGYILLTEVYKVLMFGPTGVQKAAYTVVDHVFHDVAQLEECMPLRVVFGGREKAVT